VPGEPFLEAEAVFAIRHEQAVTVADVLSRRLRLTLLTPDQGRSAAARVAELLARELSWDATRREQAVREYEADVAQYAVPG
jgi:glycerol-3-phosphate dehydrogenase